MSNATRQSGGAKPILALAHELRGAIDERDAAVERSMRRCAAAPQSRERAVRFLRTTQSRDGIYEAAVHDALARYGRAMRGGDG